MYSEFKAMVEVTAESSSSASTAVQQQHAQEQEDAAAAAGRFQQERDRATLWRHFCHDYYTNDAMVAIDTAFYLIHVVSTTMQRHIFGTPAQKLGFRIAILFCAAVLVLCLFFRHSYKRVRSSIVLATHIVLTMMRAAVFQQSSSRQAVLNRGPTLVVEEDLQVAPMLVIILAITAVPFRLFEVLGLQQTFAMHAVVSVAFLALHPAAALPGAR